MAKFEIVCLANSRKLNGRCVAGLTTNGEWIRPVSDDADGTLYRQHYFLDSGNEAALLDLVRVPVREHVPEDHQPENWLVAPGQWQHLGVIAPDAARRFLREQADAGPDLLGNRSDRVSVGARTQAPGAPSLALVEPAELSWFITTSMRGNRQARALFKLGDATYNLSITDPEWESRLRPLAQGTHNVQEGGLAGDESLFLTVSLSEPFNGDCFKLVAGIVALP